MIINIIIGSDMLHLLNARGESEILTCTIYITCSGCSNQCLVVLQVTIN